MIKNEAEIRVAVLAIVVAVLALNGFVGGALAVLAVLLPWRPLFSAASYLVQPIVDWRVRLGGDGRERGLGRIEQELNSHLGEIRRMTTVLPPLLMGEVDISPGACKNLIPAEPHAFAPANPNEPTLPMLLPATPTVCADFTITSIIEDHVRKFPDGVFGDMSLEIGRVNVSGENAEALVMFKSPQVKELAISQRYLLRKSGGRWKVESRQPANSYSNVFHHSNPVLNPPAAAHIGMA